MDKTADWFDFIWTILDKVMTTKFKNLWTVYENR